MAAQNEKKNKKRKGWSGFWLFFHYLAKSSVLAPWHAMVLKKIGKTKRTLIEFILFQIFELHYLLLLFIIYKLYSF